MSAESFLRPVTELNTRFCFVCFDGKDALDELNKTNLEVLDEDFLKKYCTPIVEGVQLLKNWVIKIKNQ